MKKLTISIDMGAKNNGVFIAKTDNETILENKASCVVIDGNLINFSKKDRRENRHKDRNYKRRRLARRVLNELVDFSQYNEKQTESIMGLLKNRGYTFLSSTTEFEKLEKETLEFIDNYLSDIQGYTNKDKFEEFFTNEFEDEKELVEFLQNQIQNINNISNDLQNYSNKKKILSDLESLQSRTITKFKSFSFIKNMLFNYDYKDLGKNEKEITASLKKDDFDNSNIDFEKEFEYINKLNFTTESETNKPTISKNLKELKDFFIGIKKEIDTGSKPRKKYIKEIEDEIKNLDFIENKEKFLNLIANISNLQLRVLRKFFNYNSQKNDRYEILKKYFISHHYKKESEKETKKELLTYLESNDNLVDFLQNTPPSLTIPPYEDMNNRNTYKCNSMLIKPQEIDSELKNTIDIILKNPNFEALLITDDYGLFERKEEYRVKPQSSDKYIKDDFTYSKYLQRILDSTSERTTRELNPREVFKHKAMFERGTISAITMFKKEFSEKLYKTLEPIATRYYAEESKIINGIYEESSSMFMKCNTNTSYKNNVKHTLLKPIYSYKFTEDEADKFIKLIESKRGLKTALEHISSEAKKYQNSFYSTVLACKENEKCSADKEIVKIVKNLDSNIATIKEILAELEIKNSYFDSIQKIDEENIKRVLNILKQTYEILFKELGGFSKTCKHCTKENSIRSDENLVIGKRLLSDVAKPIDGMLDMMLDRLAYEISEQIDSSDIKDVEELEILLEQNRFEFEENLNTIKRASNSQIKKYKRDSKDALNVSVCPYTGKPFDKGDYDHILPQSKGVYNSKANMIYCSTDGNSEKGATIYKLENLQATHLKAVFKSDNLEQIKEFISKHIKSIDSNNFTNFENLKLPQQIALRYALFMPNGSEAFKKAFTLVKLDKIKTITNGTQKRLARKIYEKLVQKFPKAFKQIAVDSKTVSSELVSSTRKLLSETKEQMRKQTIQNSHSHCIDAMVVFYLANSKVRKNEPLESRYDFDDIYLEESTINNLVKNKTFINSTFKQSASVALFQGTIYSENYYVIKKVDEKFIAKSKEIKLQDIENLIYHKLLYKNQKNKKYFIEDSDKIEPNDDIKIDISKLSNKLYELFNSNDTASLKALKFLDNFRYNTTRKEIESIFFDEKRTKLKEFEKIKDIPATSKNLFKAVHKKLRLSQNLFRVNDEKQFLDSNILNELLKDMFSSKQKNENKEQRKRAKKRHKYTLPVMGQNAKYKIKRDDTWQILGGENIATKNYLIGGTIKAIPYFTKNTLPLKIADLIDCLLVDEKSISVYDVAIKVDKISNYVSKLEYFVTEASRHTIVVTFRKNGFEDIDFDTIKQYDGAKDNFFKAFIENYIDNKELEIYNYIGSIRDGLKAKATVINNTKDSITLKYKAGLNVRKKEIILENLKD
ncbi:MAG: hypothetical protein U9P72_07140 [Campylobacterota bacterium]|nr:hypothetical protein [Campylobacterota bacterium]